MSSPENLARISLRNHIVYWEFFRVGDRYEIKAAACVTKGWKGEEGSPSWEVDAENWAETAAQGICDRLDYEESFAGKENAAQEEYRKLKSDIEWSEDRRAALKVEYPGITDTLTP